MKKSFFMPILAVLFISMTLTLGGCSTKQVWEDVDNGLEAVLETDNAIDSSSQNESMSTISKIFKEWKPVTCHFMMNMWSDQIFDGTLSVDWKKMRYSMNWFIEGQSIENYIIIKDWYSYSWSSLDPKKWYKMKENDETDKYEEVWAEEQDQETKFTCKKGIEWWEFDLPGDVVFEEFNYDNSNI